MRGVGVWQVEGGAGAFGGVVDGGQLVTQVAGKDDRVAVLSVAHRPNDVVGARRTSQ